MDGSSTWERRSEVRFPAHLLDRSNATHNIELYRGLACANTSANKSSEASTSGRDTSNGTAVMLLMSPRKLSGG